jgi:hypothetical protein
MRFCALLLKNGPTHSLASAKAIVGWLYENQMGKSGLMVTPKNTQCVGAAYSLGLCFARSLFTDDMPIAWAQVVAAHLIKQCKEYADGWCGGETHPVTLPAYGDPAFETDQVNIAKLESHLAEVDQAIRLALPSHDTPDETLQLRLKILNRVVKKLLAAYIVGTPCRHPLRKRRHSLGRGLPRSVAIGRMNGSREKCASWLKRAG